MRVMAAPDAAKDWIVICCPEATWVPLTGEMIRIAGRAMGLGVAVKVGVAVGVADAVCVGDGVAVCVGVIVAVCVGVDVRVAVEVIVALAPASAVCVTCRPFLAAAAWQAARSRPTPRVTSPTKI